MTDEIDSEPIDPDDDELDADLEGVPDAELVDDDTELVDEQPEPESRTKPVEPEDYP
jgi:hypothetical protein